MRLAVLFGSLAVGSETERSDIDLLVALRDRSAMAAAALSQRVSDRLGRDVQLVRIEDAERSALLMSDVLSDGRVLIDRDGLWAGLKARERQWRRRATSENVALEDAMPDLELS